MRTASKRLIIVGGVAGGATAAARARRLDENAEIIVIERGADVSFANCGLPYHIGGEIPSRDALLVQTKAGLTARFRLDIRTRHEVTAIDRDAQTVQVRDLETGREYTERYYDLLLSPGASPIRPPITGVEHASIFMLRNMADMDRIKAVVDGGAESAIIVGGGFIGLEMADNLRTFGLDVALVEMLPQVMPPLDPEVAALVHRELDKHGVCLHLADAVTRFEDADGRVRAELKSGRQLEADLVILCVGVKPDTGFLQNTGLEFNERGAIVVDERMRTNDPHIYAVGDAVQVNDPVLGGPTMIPLAGPANRQARIAADNIFGRESRYRGTQGTSVVGVFGLTVGLTGASEKVLARRAVPFRKVFVHRGNHVGYYPGAQRMMIKLLFGADDGKVLGAQVVGGHGVDKRIDVFATAIHAGMTVADLEDIELAYAPQYGAAKDPVNIAGYVANNVLRGDEEFVIAEELGPPPHGDWTIIDTRDPEEFEADHIPGARLLPLQQIRERWQEIPRDKPIVTYCEVGQRAYYVNRILRQHGLSPRNLSGGYTTYLLVHGPQPTPKPLPTSPGRKSEKPAAAAPLAQSARPPGGCCG